MPKSSSTTISARLFSEINLASDKLGKKYSERNAKLCAIVQKIAEGLAQFSTDADTLGDAYEYLIGQFAAGSGKKTGEFYTPQQLDGLALRRQCARFIHDHQQAIAQAQPAIPSDLNDRAGDIWEPLLALADLAGGRWPELTRQAAVGLTISTQETNPFSSLLLDLLLLFVGEGADRIFSRDLILGLNSLTDRPWRELCPGKALTELWLAQQLRPYGIRPRSFRAGNRVARGYARADFGDLFQRYIPQSEVEALLAESNPSTPAQNQAA